MAKTIPAQKFKDAIKALNEVLKANDEEMIKYVGVKKEVAFENFTNKILDFIEKDRAVDLPDVVIDFYNNYIVEEDTKPKKKKAKEDAKPEEAEKNEDSDLTTEPKSKKTEKPKKAPGVIALAVKSYLGGNTTAKDIEANIGENFPDKNISSTVATVLCIMNHIPKENLK